MPHIFISYAKVETQALAFALYDHFNDIHGMTAWVDRNLTAGRNWESEIQREIRKCDVFIVLYSPDINRHLYDESKSESYVLEEIAYARYTLNKMIIPVMAQLTEPPLGMTRMQYINFAAGGMTLLQLSKKILQEAGISAPVEVVVTQPYSPSQQMPLPNDSLTVAALPQFAWTTILGGRVTLTVNNEEKIHSLKPYQISQQPITNAQYAKFIEGGGYNERRWWTGKGWAAKEAGYSWRARAPGRRNGSVKIYKPSDKPWDAPLKSEDAKHNGPDQPVAGVSWYEAVAFCLWLREITGETVLLPTEPQWQRAIEYDEAIKDSTLGHFEWCLTDHASLNNDIHENLVKRTIRDVNNSRYLAKEERPHYRSDQSEYSQKRGIFAFRIIRSTED